MHHWRALHFDAAWMKDASGYLASALVLCTFSVTCMRRLRLIGIASNLAFICYAIIAGMSPILILHCLLLPMNIYRLAQLEFRRSRSIGLECFADVDSLVGPRQTADGAGNT